MFLILGSVALVSAVAAVAVLFAYPVLRRFERTVNWFVAFAAGCLLGDVFFHILPEATALSGFTAKFSLSIVVGLLVSFVIERYVHFHHCHDAECDSHDYKKSLPLIMFLGDGLHNFIDGIAIGASYLVSIPTGIATTVAVLFHEIPQELGDAAIMAQSGYTLRRAIILNCVTAATAFVGVGMSLAIHAMSSATLIPTLLGLTAGNFIYLATADIIPHLHQSRFKSDALIQPLAIILGFATMWILLILAQ